MKEASKPEVMEEEKSKEMEEQKEMIDFIKAITQDYALLQLPANLPLEGCYHPTPKTENIDIDLKNENGPKDLLSVLLSTKFDSTGYYLEREFSNITDDPLIKERKETALSIGKLCKLRNGKFKIKIGENMFDINEGVPDHFLNEVTAINVNDHEALSLMKLNHKFVLKPDMFDILNSNPK